MASHHHTVDPILDELRSALEDLTPQQPTIPFFSCTSRTRDGSPAFGADYWVDNLRQPVRFAHAVAEAAEKHDTFLEISPHPLLSHAITETLGTGTRSDGAHVTGTLNRDADDTVTFHTNLAGVQPPSENADIPGAFVDLPSTPWMHTPFWLSNRMSARPRAGVHPLLGTHVEMPSGHGHIWQADVGVDALPWMSDHKVHGQVVMPAAALAEIALAAGSQALDVPVAQIRVIRLEVEQMLPLAEETTLTTSLERTAEPGHRVEVHSRSATGVWRRHAVAHVEEVPPAPPAVPPVPDSGPREHLPVNDFYAALRRTGAHHGPAFAGLTRIDRTGALSAESEIALPDEVAPDPAFHIHPVMLDTALQTLAAAMPAETVADPGEVTYLPVSIDAVRVHAVVGRTARCRAELTNLDAHGAGKLGRILLMNDEGQTTAEITGVYLRRVERRTVPLPLSQKLFGTTWHEATLSEKAASEKAASWLLLSGGPDAEAHADRFSAAFGSSGRRVLRGNLFDEPALLDVFADVAADPARPPTGVVVFLGDRRFGGSDDSVVDDAEELILGIIGAVRAVVGGWHGRSPRLWLISRGGLSVTADEPGSPAIGALRGLIRVLTYEHPDLRATLIDFDEWEVADTALAMELESRGHDDVIAWRGGRRFAERLSRVPVPVRRADRVVRPDASYVITGGLGGLGLVVAGWLIDNGAGRVVLNGRSTPTEEQRGQLTELAGRGDIIYAPGDVGADGVADRLVEAAQETGLPLRGVVHAAAVLDDGLLTSLTKDNLDRVWGPKVAGALRLHHATDGQALDWWVGFSSVAGLFGSPGQTAYACANAWLDALGTWRRAAGLPASIIDWGQWADVGLARAMNFHVLDPLSPAEGVEALEVLLGGDLPHAAVARLRLDRAAAAFPEIKNFGYFSALVAESDEMNTSGDWAGPEALVDIDQADVAGVVLGRLRERTSAIMGFADPGAIDVDQPLTEIGMDSLMAVRIRNTARGDFGVEPAVALLLQGATLQDLATDLVDQLGLAAAAPATGSTGLRDRAQQRAGARQRAATRRKAGQRL